LDSVAPRTLLGLTRNPGKVAREYVDGRRAEYVQPFRYCLTSVALLMLVYALVGRNANYFILETDPTLSPAMVNFQAKTIAFVVRHLNVVFFAALPVQALILKGLFHRSRFNYAEIMSFTLFVAGHGFLFGAVLAATLFSVPQLQVILRILLTTGYLVFASIGFFEEHRGLTALKCVVAKILNTVVVVIMVLILIMPQVVALVKEMEAEEALAAPATEELEMKRSMFILYVSDQQASRDFYAAVLARSPVLDVPGMTEFNLADGSTLGLMPESGIQKLLGGGLAEPAFGGGGGLRAEVYLLVDDPRECLQRAVNAGARLLSECTDRDWGDLAGYCLDADGYVIGFAAPIEKDR
jgi:catechol 2,3-dioxygenase-like lactoylglutathione lyase family enzyme